MFPYWHIAARLPIEDSEKVDLEEYSDTDIDNSGRVMLDFETEYEEWISCIA